MWQCPAPPMSRERWSSYYYFYFAKKSHLTLSHPIGIETRCGRNPKFSRACWALLQKAVDATDFDRDFDA